jgi:hypothetical protein
MSGVIIVFILLIGVVELPTVEATGAPPTACVVFGVRGGWDLRVQR